MPRNRREKTKYPGVFFIDSLSPATGKPERIYYARFRKDGRMIEEKVGRQHADNITPAKAARIRARRMEKKEETNRERREAEEAARLAETSRWTMAKLWKEFYEHKIGNKSIRDDYFRWHKHLHKDFADKTPDEIITLDVDRIRLKMLKAKYAPATVRQIVVLLQRVIRFAAKRGLCKTPDPSKLHFEKPKVDNERTECLSEEQTKALLQSIANDSNIMAGNALLLSLYSGMRKNEIFRLKWDDLDFKKNFIKINNPKGGKSVSIPLNRAAKEVLENHPRNENSPYVFPGRYGGHCRDMRHAVARIRNNAGLPKSFRPFHGLRHTFASMLASSGQVDMYTLQKLLTHKSPAMTQRYAHLRDEALQKASELAGEIVSQIADTEENDAKQVINIESHRK